MTTKTFVADIRQLIAKGELEEALTRLQRVLANSPKLNEVLLQSARHSDVLQQIRLGVISYKEGAVTKNKITHGLLDLLTEVEKQTAEPTIQEELRQAISIVNSKNVVLGSSITSGRDTHIGDIEHHHHYEAQNRIPRQLTQPPFYSKDFLGRETELANLHQKLFAGENLLFLVNGAGGVGKTSLAARYYQKYQNEYTHVAWVLSEKSIADALLLLAVTLGLKFDEKMVTEERLSLLLTRLANLEKTCLLVIDNANELEDLKTNFQHLSSCTNFHILLTTRISKFEDAVLFPVKGLPEKEAVELFKKHYPDHQESEDDLLKDIIIAVENNTLIVELFAKNLQRLNELEPEYDLHQLLKDIQDSLLAMSKSEMVSTVYQAKGTGLRDESPEAIISAMYNVGELPEDEKKVISIFAVLPNERITYQVLKDLLPDTELKAPVLSLAQKGWIEYNKEDKSFKVNQVVQDVVKVKHGDRLQEDCEQLVDTLATVLSHNDLLHIDNYEATLVVIRYASSIINAVHHPTFDLARLCQNIGDFHENIGDLISAMEAYQRMEGVLNSLISRAPENPDFKNGLAISYSKLGETHSSLGNLSEALKYFEDRSRLGQELYESYPQNVSFKNGLAISYAKLGVFNRDQLKNKNEARSYFLKAKKLWDELIVDAPQYAQFQRFSQMIERDLHGLD
ncbi:MAG: NB-ARC domain-containing protein [Lewinella sp.]|uniref:NB-ARC domain-containing protein n=1 Tax=Lewinella sp. TaxID=2004506 RepID=UPI003D6AD073